MVPPGFCIHEILGMGQQTFAPLPHCVSLTKHKFKEKIDENFMMVATEHETNLGGFLSVAFHVPLKSAFPGALWGVHDTSELI
jgi:hypothetical protein